MVEEIGPIRKFRRTAFWCHVALALIVCVALAMQIHLTAIQATPEVVGAGAFLVFMWVGVPAVALVVWAVVNSVKAADRELLFLTAVLVVLIVTALWSAPLTVVAALEVLYLALVVRLGIVWWRRDRLDTLRTNDVPKS